MNGTKLYKCNTCNRENTNYKTHWAHQRKCVLNVYLDTVDKLAKHNSDMRTVMLNEFREITKLKLSNKICGEISDDNFDVRFVVNELCRDSGNMAILVKRITEIGKALDNYVSEIQRVDL